MFMKTLSLVLWNGPDIRLVLMNASSTVLMEKISTQRCRITLNIADILERNSVGGGRPDSIDGFLLGTLM